jgi:1,4-dihydroxy-2-naphthoate octaprenyltransferase
LIANWILAARPKTLLAGLSPVAIGAALALRDGKFHLTAMLGALLCAISVQIGTNFCNDYCDFFQGADTDERKGPTRAVHSGLITPRSMLIATILMFAITALAAYFLYLRAGWIFLALGAFSILFGVLYTAGRYSLAYLGIADPFVLFFFGPVAVAGTYYVQALRMDWPIMIAGLGPGLIATGLLVVNNLRDIDEDRTANKRTLAVRFGALFSRYQYTACIVASALVPVVFALSRNVWWTLLASLVIVPGSIVIRKVWSNDGFALRPCLGMTAGLLLLYTVLFCAGLAL